MVRGRQWKTPRSKNRTASAVSRGSSSAASATCRFVNAGDLPEWSASLRGKSRRRDWRNPSVRGNAFGYTYENDAAVDGADPVVVFEDRRPSDISVSQIPLYDCYADVMSHHGLGYGIDEWESGKEREDEVEDLVGDDLMPVDSTPSPMVNAEIKRSEGFLSIGRFRLYTEDVSSPEDVDYLDTEEEDDDNNDDDEEEEEEDTEDEDGEKGGDGVLDDDVSTTSPDNDFSDESEIDGELAEDYMEGTGGISGFQSLQWIIDRNLEIPGEKDDSLKNGKNDDAGRSRKLGGLALMRASMEYGMKKPRQRKGKRDTKYSSGSSIIDLGCATPDEVLLMKDSRKYSMMTKSSSRLSRSWPCGMQSNNSKHVKGGKKKLRKELVAVKRRARMINRGVDLDDINIKLRNMVLNEVDMFSFQPMQPRDCSQIQRLAAIYRLKSGCEGSGRKRFVTVSRTLQTCLPSSVDAQRLTKLLGTGTDQEDFAVNSNLPRNWGRGGWKPRNCSRNLDDSSSGGRRKQLGGNTVVVRARYSDRPVSFVSSGVMCSEPVAPKQAEAAEAEAASCSSEAAIEDGGGVEKGSFSMVGAFEMHTRGFGSRMLAKMGYVEGGGLGKDGQGMSRPIEVVKRPKALGLGVEFVEEEPAAVVAGRRAAMIIGAKVDGGGSVGSFEKHTRGFGSKMMEKMGFVPGSGLGKDGQGITHPLTAVRLPKSRGLGANERRVAR